MSRMEIAIALEEGMILESEDGKKFVVQEDMCGGQYGMYENDEEFGWCGPVLTDNLEKAIEFVS